MINSAILSQKVSDKLSQVCLCSIVTEAFIKALPLTKDGVALESEKYLNYSNTVLKSLHSESLLTRAMESNAQNENAMKMLNGINDTITSVVTEATNRICKEAKNCNSCTTLEEVVDSAAFTPEEMKKFASKGKDIAIEEISNVIKKKVVTAIKSEKEAYDNNKKLETDVVEALQDTLGEKAPTLEAYLDIVLEKKDARKPVSFFSRLQDTCLEALMVSDEDEDEDEETVSLESLVDTTITSTLNCFDTSVIPTTSALESMSKVLESHGNMEGHEAKVAHCMKKSLIMAIVIMTMLETLKTMRLFSPKFKEVQDFVDAPTKVNGYNPSNVSGQIHDEVIRIKKLASDVTMNRPELTTALDNFSSLKNKVSTISEETLPQKTAIMEELTDACTLLSSKLAEDREPGIDVEPLEYYTNLKRESNIAEMDRVARLLFRRPGVKSVNIHLNGAAEYNDHNEVRAYAIGEDDKTFLDCVIMIIQMCPAFKTLTDEVTTAAKYSNLANYQGRVNLYFTNKCYSVPLCE